MDTLPTYSDFKTHLKTCFTMHIADGSTREVTLFEVSDLISRPQQESFALVFSAPADTPPDQQLYRLEHSDLGAMDLFLVPIGLNDQGVRFEAVFNRLYDE